MDDGNTQAIAQYLDNQEDWDALQEVTAELEQAESDNILLIVRIEELEAKLAKAMQGLENAMDAGMAYSYDRLGYDRAVSLLNRLKGEQDD